MSLTALRSSMISFNYASTEDTYFGRASPNNSTPNLSISSVMLNNLNAKIHFWKNVSPRFLKTLDRLFANSIN